MTNLQNIRNVYDCKIIHRSGQTKINPNYIWLPADRDCEQEDAADCHNCDPANNDDCQDLQWEDIDHCILLNFGLRVEGPDLDCDPLRRRNCCSLLMHK